MDFALFMKFLPYFGKVSSMLPLLGRILARGFSVNAVGEDLKDAFNFPPLLDWLKARGASDFPAVRPELQTAAGVLTYAPDYVSKIQKLLNQVVSPSPNLDVDGYIGVKTKDAVAKYQKAKGLVVDGFPGDNTLVALREDAVKTVPLLLGGEGEKKNTVEVPKVAPAGVNPILNAKP